MRLKPGDKVKRFREFFEYPLDGSVVTVKKVSAAQYFIQLEEGNLDYVRASHFMKVDDER